MKVSRPMRSPARSRPRISMRSASAVADGGLRRSRLADQHDAVLLVSRRRESIGILAGGRRGGVGHGADARVDDISPDCRPGRRCSAIVGAPQTRNDRSGFACRTNAKALTVMPAPGGHPVTDAGGKVGHGGGYWVPASAGMTVGGLHLGLASRHAFSFPRSNASRVLRRPSHSPPGIPRSRSDLGPPRLLRRGLAGAR